MTEKPQSPTKLLESTLGSSSLPIKTTLNNLKKRSPFEKNKKRPNLPRAKDHEGRGGEVRLRDDVVHLLPHPDVARWIGAHPGFGL